MHSRRPPRGIVLDMDSSVSPTYDDQEGTAYNGHFACTRYHSLFVFTDITRLGMDVRLVPSTDIGGGMVTYRGYRSP